jgi:hypothetical protein
MIKRIGGHTLEEGPPFFWSCNVLVLYLERPHARVRVGMRFGGRFGYSDLKEAALMGGYVF